LTAGRGVGPIAVEDYVYAVLATVGACVADQLHRVCCSMRMVALGVGLRRYCKVLSLVLECRNEKTVASVEYCKVRMGTAAADCSYICGVGSCGSMGRACQVVLTVHVLFHHHHVTS
jgi:hypothetical protein